MDILVLYNEPTLPKTDPDWASEAGVFESVDAVSRVLAARGHQVESLGLAGPMDGILQTLSRLPAADVVFNLFEGLGGVGQGESEIAGLLELMGYPLTGSPAECLALVRHKARTKWMLAGAGLPTAPFVLVDAKVEPDRAAIDLLLRAGPVIVKPAHEDASLGIGSASVVRDAAALAEQIESVRRRYGAVLVEQFIVGREFNAAVIDLERPRLLPLAEIEFNGPEPAGWQLVTYDAKWAAGSQADLATQARCPAQVEAATAERIGQIALAAFQLTGCRHFARVDLRMNQHGEMFVLEINANPDIGPSAGFCRALRAAGIDFGDFVEGLVQSAVDGGRTAAARTDQLSTRR